MNNRVFPVVDLFAGPGGLGEGFSAFADDKLHPFDVRLSIEKDSVACETLRLRKFFREFSEPPEEYTHYVSGNMQRADLYSQFPKQAKLAADQTWCAELGKKTQSLVYARVRRAIGAARNWVLLGGPPCQAYSIVGRSRMKSRLDFEADERHFLYKEYLRIVANQRPTIFVMENVKGLLSATHGGQRIFERIQSDLRQPGKAARIHAAHDVVYDLHALAIGKQRDRHGGVSDSFLVRAEDYGIPQTRHRVIIIGVRRGLHARPGRLDPGPPVAVADVLADLPEIRSRLSREPDSPAAWREAVAGVRTHRWFQSGNGSQWADVAKHARAALESLRWPTSAGAPYLAHKARPIINSRWYRHNATGLTMHEARSHMRSDLWRYFFCVCYTAVRGRSPDLRDFPPELYPAHKNLGEALKGEKFGDRFRVQQADRPASTVTSHIAKDGHYFIHYDPRQCRSLTPREAARIQTFPDSYFFEGNRTEQFHQIGNAVPPLLAREIAGIVYELLSATVRSR